MIPTNRTPSHPGEILLNEFLIPLEMSQMQFAKYLKVPVQRINEIIKKKRGISPESAWLFSEALGTTPEFWLNLQNTYDLATHKPNYHIEKIVAA